MAVQNIIRYPHSVLRQPCADISDITADIRRLADDMRETMIYAGGIGLAAPQIGESLRLLVASVSESAYDCIQLANPRIIGSEGHIALEEGCLSVPGVRAPVKRARSVTVRGIDMNGAEQIIEADDLLAVCLQHEIDHLDGVLFFDRISAFRRARLLMKYNKQTAD